jgi:hypothetical protein
MKRPRFTIGELILVVIVVAIGLAAIRSGSAVWAGAMTSIAFFAMVASILGVVLGRGMRRAYWSGFALLGWSYLLLSHVTWLDGQIGNRLLAPRLFSYLAEVLHSEVQGGAAGGTRSVAVAVVGALPLAGGFGGGSAGGTGLSVDLADFVQIGLAMEALLWAFLGGRVACYFASASERDRRPASAPSAAAAESDERAAAGNAAAPPSLSR